MTPTEPPRRLGRGLDALLARREAPAAATAPVVTGATTPSAGESAATGPRTLPIADIRPNPYQPRKEFRPEELADLEASLRISGLLQPITVRPAASGRGYELIAGERRLRAATRLGWTEIPALVRPTDDRTMLTLAMVENLQRADLDPIEEADGYQRLVDEFSLTQQEVADVVGKDRSTVANALRLLQLPASVRRLLQERQLSAGHARALLPLGTEHAIASMARECASAGWSVREVERRVQAARSAKAGAGKTGARTPIQPTTASGRQDSAATAELRRLEELVRRKLQTGATIHLTGAAQGELRLAFYSHDDLERLLELIGIDLDA